jgi:hypothetical protein
MSWTFGKLDGLRSLDVLASRYGRLPHELVPDFPSSDPYVVYCFDEAVALAGLSVIPPVAFDEVGTQPQLLEEPARRIDTKTTRQQAPRPTQGAVIGMSNGVPFISGKVPVARKKSPE